MRGGEVDADEATRLAEFVRSELDAREQGRSTAVDVELGGGQHVVTVRITTSAGVATWTLWDELDWRAWRPRIMADDSPGPG